MSAQSAIYNPSQTTSAATGDGFSTPRLTTAGRLAISFTTKDAGMMVYDTDLNNLFIWTGAAWESVPASGDAGANGSVQYNDNGVVSGAVNFVWDKTNNRVGIGTASPGDTLDVNGRVTALRYLSSSSNAALPSFAVSSGNGVYNSGTNEIGFSINSTSAMTLNSTGLGVGGAPLSGFRLNVNNGDFRVSDVQNEDGVELGWSAGAGTGFVQVYNRTTSAFKDLVLNNAATITASGNVGIGVTPSAWGSGYTALQNRQTSWFSTSARDLNLGANVYVDGVGYKYIATAAASNYVQYLGAHSWYTAASGTAGNAITFTQAMTLDASGNLFVGKTATGLGTVGIQASPSGWFQATVSGDASIFTNRLASDGKTIQLYRQTLEVGNISVTTTGATFNSTSDYRLKEAVAPLSGGLARVNALKPSVYKWKSNGLSGEGFLAHELAEVVPAAVNGEKDDVNEDGSIKAQSIDMSRVVPILVAAIQELTARVQTLETR